MYHLYIAACADGTLYTGITTDLDRRLAEHNSADSKVGAKYTRARQPVTMVYSKKFKDRSQASVAEAAMKKLSREEKMELIAVEALIG